MAVKRTGIALVAMGKLCEKKKGLENSKGIKKDTAVKYLNYIKEYGIFVPAQA